MKTERVQLWSRKAHRPSRKWANLNAGREGSDYSAALMAVACSAASVTIWKDVPGMMNADPKRHLDAVTVPKVDHAEALELSYYGASVIHPRTVKPLQHVGIPLHVKSFLEPNGPSTCIDAFPGLVPEVPMFIWRDNLSFIEVHSADGSFLVEDHLTALFGALDQVNPRSLDATKHALWLAHRRTMH